MKKMISILLALNVMLAAVCFTTTDSVSAGVSASRNSRQVVAEQNLQER